MTEVNPYAEFVTDTEVNPYAEFVQPEEVAQEQNEPGFINSLKRGGNRVAQSISAFDLATSLAYEQANKGLYKETNNPRYLKAAEQNKTDAGQFFSDVVNTQKDIESYPQHPDTQAAMKAAGEAGELVKKYGDPDKFLGNGALGQSLAAISELSNKFGESDNKMGIAADLVGEQIPNMAATILGSKGIGSLLGVAAPKLAGTLLGEAAVVGGGSAIGSFASTYGTNVSDGIQKGMTPEAAANYGAKKSAIQSLTDGVAGAFVPIKFGSQVVNIPTQTAIQMIGGGGGEYLASIGVGEVPNLSDVVLEGVLEVIGLPGDMVSASLAKDGKAAPKPTNKSVIPDDPNAPTTTGTLEEMLTGTVAQSIMEKQAQGQATTNATTPTQEVMSDGLSPKADTDTAKSTIDTIRSGDMQNIDHDVLTDLVNTGMVVPTADGKIVLTQEGESLALELDNLVTPSAPTVADQVQSGEIDSDAMNAMKQSGEVQFKDGAWQRVNQESAPINDDVQSVVDAYNSNNPNLKSDAVRSLLANGKVNVINGRMEVVEAAPTDKTGTDDLTAIRAIKDGSFVADKAGLVNKLVGSGNVQFGNDGKLEITESGNKLLDESSRLNVPLDSPTTQPQATVNAQTLPQKPTPTTPPIVEDRNSVVEDEDASTEGEVEQATAEEEAEIAAYMASKQSPTPKAAKAPPVTPTASKRFDDMSPTELREAYDTRDNFLRDLGVEGHDLPFSNGRPDITELYNDIQRRKESKTASNAVAIKEKEVDPYEVARDARQKALKAELNAINNKHQAKWAKNWADIKAESYKNLTQEEIDRVEDIMTKWRAERERFKNGADKTYSGYAKTDISSKTSAPLDVDGRFSTDKSKMVLSDKGGALSFDTNKQAAKWIIEVGHKQSSDQVFEIANHPTKGFSVVERGRSETETETESDIPFSVTPSPKFEANKDQLKAKVTAIIRKINPSVNISLVDNLMGEGQALKDSGAESTDAQEVAGAYSRLKNLIYASMNTDKWNPEDTAYHEAFHSIFDMLSPTDKAILTKAFPGKGDITSEEQMAIEFARFMTEKNATGFTPAVRRIFLAMKEALRQIGRTLKLGKFESFEDVFNKVESGEVYKGRDAAREAVASANVAKLDKMLTDGEITQEQLKNAVERISPELYDVVYGDTEVSEEDEVAMADMVAESTGLPEDVLYSVTKRVFSKVTPDREKMLKGFVNFVSPVIGKKNTEEALADIDNTIKNTKKPDNEKSDKLNKFMLVGRVLAQTADGSGRYIANAYNSKAMHKVLDFFYHDAGKDKSVEGTYHENVAEYIGINTNKIAKVLYSLNDKQLDQVTDMLQNPNKVFEATDRVRNAAKVIAQIIKEQRAYLEDAGMPVVHELEGYFPRIYDADKIMQNLEEFSKAARQAYSLTFADDLHKEHSKLKGEVDRLTKKQQSYEKNLLNDPNYGNRKTDAGTKYSTLFESRAKKLENIKRNYSESPDVYVGNVLTEKVDRWIESIAKAAQFGHSHDDDFNVLSDLPPQPDETKHRVLTKEADEIMRQFVMRNPVDVMTASLGRAARAAEFNRRLGKEQWVALKKQMQDEGVDKEGLIQIKKVIYANTGMLNHIDGKARDALGAVRYWSNLMFLSKSALSSLSEGFTVATKTGDVRDGLRTMYDGFRAAFKTKGTQEMRDISDMYGITGEIADDMMMMQRTGGEYDSRARAYKNARLFRKYALTGLTSGQMSATFKTGQFFIGKLAEHIATNHNRKLSSEFLMSEYGVPKDKIEEFSKWVTTNGGGKLSTEFGLGNSEMAKYYRTALQRFVKTTVQVPTAATRQRYASTPVGQFVYGLSSYINAYSKNVLIRNYRIGKEVINMDKGYTAADRVAMASQVMMVPVLGLMAAAVGEMRDELFPNPDAKEKTLVDRGLTAVSRASFVGSFDPLLNMFGSFRYQRDPLNTFNGPVPSMVAGMIKAFGNLFMNNSENTNTAERNAAKLTYATTIAPYLTSAIATNLPWGKVGFAAIQAVNAPITKSAVADAVAGKAKQK